MPIRGPRELKERNGMEKEGRADVSVKGRIRGFISEKGCKDCSRATFYIIESYVFLANSPLYCSIIIRLMPCKLSREAKGLLRGFTSV